MQEHFTLMNSIYLVVGKEKWDLHNNYDFVGLDYSIANRFLVLQWIRKAGDWIPLDSPTEVKLEFHNVTRFEFHPRDPETPFSEDNCLWEVGYWRDAGWPDGVTSGLESGVFCAGTEPEEDWLRAFQFHSGAIVLVGAIEAHAKTKG